MFIGLLPFLISSAGMAQPVGQSDVTLSAYCLVRLWPKAKLSTTTGMYYSYRDTKSYSGITHIILLTRSGKRRGQVFDFEVYKKATPVVRLVNNADIRFNRTRPEFATPPLGGLWTQDVLLHSVSMAMNAPAGRLPEKGVRTKKAVHCESYAATQ
jgi:hypothetical protein